MLSSFSLRSAPLFLLAGLLTFVIGGGGFSGVECIAELNDFMRNAVKSYPNIDESDVRCVLLQSADRILPELGEDLAAYLPPVAG